MKSLIRFLFLGVVFALPCSTAQAGLTKEEGSKPAPTSKPTPPHKTKTLQTSYKVLLRSNDQKVDLTANPSERILITAPPEFALSGWACYRRAIVKTSAGYLETGIQCKNSIVESIVTIAMSCNMYDEDDSGSGFSLSAANGSVIVLQVECQTNIKS